MRVPQSLPPPCCLLSTLPLPPAPLFPFLASRPKSNLLLASALQLSASPSKFNVTLGARAHGSTA